MEVLDPSPNEFVVRRARAAKGSRARAEVAGEWTLVDAASDTWLWRTPAGRDARGAWESAVRSLHDDDVVLPLLRDRDGVAHYPTGEVTVRFDAAPGDDALRAFARQHRLVLERRNAYEPRQAVFTPAGPRSDWLPDVVARLAKAPGVARAWANTASSYTRA